MFVRFSEILLDTYDVIVVGSGLAGYALADRLSASGKHVLVLESGQKEFDSSVQSAYTKMYGRGNFDGAYWPNHWVRAFGGTSAVWGGWSSPLSDRNLVDWPIDRSDLDPYYAIVARLIRRSELFLTFKKIFLPGIDYRPMSIEPPPLNLSWEPEILESLPNVDIAVGVTVSGLIASTDRRAVAGFKAHTDSAGEQSFVFQRSQYIVLAAGGMGNCQILLNSGDGLNLPIGNENDQVGRYLMEHPHFFDCARIVVPADFELPRVPTEFGALVPVLEPNDSLYKRLGGLDVSIEVNTSTVNLVDPVEKFLANEIGAGAQAFTLTVRSEMTPEPANRVRLAEGRDPAGLQRVRAICYIGGESFRVVDQCLEAFGEALERTGPGRIRIDSDRIARQSTGGGHTMGTTRMGNSPRDSVVDADCRVHGYRNLYIAGSSVFRTGGYANPTLTLMALAARLGDHLGEMT